MESCDVMSVQILVREDHHFPFSEATKKKWGGACQARTMQLLTALGPFEAYLFNLKASRE